MERVNHWREAGKTPHTASHHTAPEPLFLEGQGPPHYRREVPVLVAFLSAAPRPAFVPQHPITHPHSDQFWCLKADLHLQLELLPCPEPKHIFTAGVGEQELEIRV